MKDPFVDMSYNFACQKAYKGQIRSPHVVYRRDNGLYGAMPLVTYKFMGLGTPILLVSHVSSGVRVAGWEFRDDEFV